VNVLEGRDHCQHSPFSYFQGVPVNQRKNHDEQGAAGAKKQNPGAERLQGAPGQRLHNETSCQRGLNVTSVPILYWNRQGLGTLGLGKPTPRGTRAIQKKKKPRKNLKLTTRGGGGPPRSCSKRTVIRKKGGDKNRNRIGAA